MKDYPGVREFMGRKTLKSLKETTFLKFQEVLTDHFKLVEGRDYFVNRSSNPTITIPNGSVCVFGDLDINTIGKWLSAEYSDIAVDEAQEICQLSFEKIKSRQTQTIIEKLSGGKKKNKFVMAMNPPEIADQHWTHKRFRDVTTKIKNSNMIYSRIEGNKENIPETYIEDMYDSVDTRTAEIYLKGNWTPLLSKLVYSDYSLPKDNMGNYIEGGNLKHLKYDKDLESYFFMDFGWTHAMSIGCWQYDRYNDIFYRLYEYVESNTKPETYCKFMMGEFIEHNGNRYQSPFDNKVASIIVGFEARQSRQEADGQSNIELIREIFNNNNFRPTIYVSNPGIQSGIIAVRRHILTAGGHRKLFIDPRYNKRFLRDVMAYHYPTDKEGNVVSEEPEKDGICDNTQDEARYGIGYISPIISNAVMVQKR